MFIPDWVIILGGVIIGLVLTYVYRKGVKAGVKLQKEVQSGKWSQALIDQKLNLK